MQTITWSEMIDAPRPGPRTPRPLQGSPAAVVHFLEDAIGHPLSTPRWRTPSAGGIYPYEIFLAGEDAPHLLAHVDLHRRVVTTGASSIEAMTDADRLLVALCGRPWLSMRAYGRRGFLYHAIDLGHALLNLALVCGGAGTEPTHGVKRFASTIYATTRTAQIACIDRIAVGESPAESRGWRCNVVHEGGVIPPRTEYEAAHTRALDTATRERLRRPVDPGVRALGAFIEHRKSARQFDASPDADGRISRMLETLPEQAAAVASQLGLPRPSIRVLSPQARADLLPTPAHATTALAQQDSLAQARAYVVFGMDRRPNATIDRSVRRQLLSIGAASELVYLEAARTGTAVTGVGGIDPGAWRAVTGLRTPVYVVALGVAADEPNFASPAGPEKLDRINVVA